MKNITTRQYRVLADQMDIYQFMVDVYERDWRNGVAAPFLEYALSSTWMTKAYTHKNRIWEENGKIVAFCFTENPVTDIFFNLRPGYEELADEMIAYADKNMPHKDGKRRFMLFAGQTALIEAAKKEGYHNAGGYEDLVFDFKNSLDYKLPEGYHFVTGEALDMAKISECCWKGFNHEKEEGPWHGDGEDWAHIYQAPHATKEYALAIENEAGDYACYSGMWWVPQNNLAYMEPLCTIPDERLKGLAAAALSEHYRRMKAVGATHMTGGDNPFYAKIGYGPMIHWTFWTN